MYVSNLKNLKKYTFSEVKKELWYFKKISAFLRKPTYSWFNTLEYICAFISIMKVDTPLPGRMASQYES